MEKTKKILNKALPYLLILLFTLSGTYIVFLRGFGHGDDIYFHIANTYDKYVSILEGKGLSGISSNLAQGLGPGNALFYSPLPHYTVAIIAVILKCFKMTVIGAFKLVIVLTVYISGVFMYHFAMRFTKGNRVASIFASAVYVIYPYRLFNAFCRFAFAEAYAALFIPLFFMGLYSLVNMDKDNIKITPFVEIILGGSLLYLSHNITGLYIFLAGIIYLICNITRLIKLFAKKRFIAYALSSVVLLLSISSVALFTQFQLMGTELYNITDEIRMWTDINAVTNRTGEEGSFSGFLNLAYLEKRLNCSSGRIVLGLVIYVLACAQFIIIDKLLATFKSLKYFHTLISGALFVMTVSFVDRRIEMYFAVAVFIAIYLLTEKTKIENENPNPIYKNILLWFSLGTIIMCIISMEWGFIWKIAPSILRNIQFPWRLWSTVQIMISIVIGIVINQLRSKKIAIQILTILVGFIIIASQHTIERRLGSSQSYDWLQDNEALYDESMHRGSALGHNKEYCPQIFFKNDYVPEYNSSLYYKVKRILPYNTKEENAYKLKPVFLVGEGSITVEYASSPNYEMIVNVSEDALIQMPLIYYPGYKITAYENDKKAVLESENIDGLIAFKINKGSYIVKTDYVGTPLRKISFIIAPVSAFVTLGALLYEIYRSKKEKKNA